MLGIRAGSWGYVTVGKGDIQSASWGLNQLCFARGVMCAWHEAVHSVMVARGGAVGWLRDFPNVHGGLPNVHCGLSNVHGGFPNVHCNLSYVHGGLPNVHGGVLWHVGRPCRCMFTSSKGKGTQFGSLVQDVIGINRAACPSACTVLKQCSNSTYTVLDFLSST